MGEFGCLMSEFRPSMGELPREMSEFQLSMSESPFSLRQAYRDYMAGKFAE